MPDAPPALAVKVAVCDELTDDTVAVKAALVALAGTVTVAGTVTAALLFARLTAIPLAGAVPVEFTVQASDPAPVIEALVHETVPTVSVATPAAVMLTTRLPCGRVARNGQNSREVADVWRTEVQRNGGGLSGIESRRNTDSRRAEERTRNREARDRYRSVPGRTEGDGLGRTLPRLDISEVDVGCVYTECRVRRIQLKANGRRNRICRRGQSSHLWRGHGGH